MVIIEPSKIPQHCLWTSDFLKILRMPILYLPCLLNTAKSILNTYVHQALEYCTVIKTVQNQYLVQMIIAGLRRNSNLAFSCPLQKVICY